MLCQNCHQHQANVQFRMNINGKTKQLYLCSNCYQKNKQQMGDGAMNFQQFGGFPFDDLMKGFGFSQMNGQAAPSPKMPTQQTGGNGGNGFLDQFGRNLTNMAKSGLIDPVIGRDKEISRIIEVLNRRNKNNPVLIGEPGTGKTAIAEGLAVKIAEGDVPAKLKEKEVYLLDVASLVANTGIRGQFEERMKQLIAELQQRKNVLLFIDEIHLIVGAGSAEGSMDAGNILKPALARGELQLIGATTLKEYRQIEKDAALERRFQPVQVSEPTVEATIQILTGLQKRYEDFHEVTFAKEALEACAKLSHRYIQDRFLPDKAIDLLDEAGSKLNLTIDTQDKESINERLAQIGREKEAALQHEDYEKAAKLRDEETKLEEKLQGAEETVERPVVTVEHIQQVIEEKTGIPVGKLQEDEQQAMKHLEKNLAKKSLDKQKLFRK